MSVSTEELKSLREAIEKHGKASSFQLQYDPPFNPSVELVSRLVETLIKEREDVISSLETIVKNDGTEYDHHQPRYSDGELPTNHGGSCWVTPRETAKYLIRKLRK